MTSEATLSTGRLAGGAALVVLTASVLCLAAIALVVVVLAGSGGGQPSLQGQAAPSRLALGEIPAEYLQLYQEAARRYGLDWTILAGIGKVECDHGRDAAPSCTQAGVVNSAGAGGPMQFIASTWARYGVDEDGSLNRWDPADAIFGAANYLRASGAPRNYPGAIFAYNHASWYVAEVEGWADRYRAAGAVAQYSSGEGGLLSRLQAGSPTPVVPAEGDQARLEPGDGHVAMIPEEVPAVVQAMLVAGNELQNLPYGPGGHPNPSGADEEDCSSTINYILYRSGVRPLSEIVSENPVAQDYVHWGLPGPGRWVTIFATDLPTPHVFAIIAGLRIDTSHDGTDIGPNRDQDGPRWRIFPTIPGWARWSVRHPPGL